MAMFDWVYRIEETDAKGNPYRVLVQSHDFGATFGAYQALVSQKPNRFFVMLERMRIVHENIKRPSAPRAGAEDFSDGMERKASMCGRYAIIAPPGALRDQFETRNPLINFAPRYNAAPTQQLPVIRFNPETQTRALDALRWGLVHHRAKDMSGAAKAINARAETVATKWPFSHAFAKRRCLVPASVFYEWKKLEAGKQPHAIGLKDGSTMAFAGVWESWRAPPPPGQAEGEVVRTFSIITTTPNELTALIHDRMPVIVPPAAWSVWLGETPAAPAELAELLQPYPAESMKMWPVGPEVGSVRNDYQELLAPLAAQ